MSEKRLLPIIGIILFSQATMVAGDAVTVSMRVQNVPPSIFLEEVSLKEDTIRISFSLEESNTLSDIREVIVTIYCIAEKRLVIQKFSWNGINSEWVPQPEASLLPFPGSSREKSFTFSLEAKIEYQGQIVVSIRACDHGENEASVEFSL